METAKKTSVEKRIVIGLLCLFGVTFAVALKNLGVFGSTVRKKPIVHVQQRVRIADTLVETMQEHWKNMEPQPEHQAMPSTPPLRASTTPAYTAQDLRDPLKSLLPEAPAPESQTAAVKAEKKEAVPPATPPPNLTVRGVLWGGREPQAIINDEVYRIGDTIEGAKILSIDPAGVTIEHNGAPAFYSTAAPLAAERSRSQQAQWR